MIEEVITEKLLETGELSLTELKCAALELPEHSATITLEFEGEEFGAQWNGRSRTLRGDVLTETLQDNGQLRGLLRLRQVGDVYRLELLPPGSLNQLTKVSKPIHRPAKLPNDPKKKDRRRTVDRQFHADSEYDWGPGQQKTIGFLSEARKLISEQLGAAGFDALELLELRLQGEELATLDDFEELIAVDVANVDRMPHQEAVARHALSRMRGRAVLADEVGLGKTVEAGLAMKELTLRGLAKRVLILCPAPLRDQWREEMLHKFDMTFDVAYGGADVKGQEKLILSLNLGIRAAEKLTTQPWDIVIVDEAHRAAGAGARKTREFITSLTTSCRYAFFLTATPVQNDLLELYRLVELLRPGTFTSVNAFKRQFMTRLDPRTPNDPAALRRLISSVMIRTTRAQAGVDRVVRRAADVPIDLGPRERELYSLSTDLLRNVMSDPSDAMRRRTLALRLTASPFSMGTTAMTMAQKHPNPKVRSVLNDVAHLAMDIQGSARENKALEITRSWVKEHGRVLIFSKHTDTVTSLLRRMDLEGIPARAFHSSMSVTERAATIGAFRSGDAPVMISTDAGAEGQNLQFCNCVLNYDLPWNPMRIEQRIGRVDRLTQPRDEVFVANLYARRTIDESVYRLLAEKLRMFELLFGQVTTILGELDDSKTASFESRVLEAFFAPDDTKMERLLNQLGTELVEARDRASTLIAADKGLSNWMAGAFEHRKELPKGGAAELLPEVSERARMRQRRVQAWVRRTLHALGAELLHDTGEEDGAFITAKFPEDFEEELGGRTTIHLAFDRRGLDHHPEAELCAVGSPVFDELLALLRMRGDLYATVPVIPDDPGPSPFRHSERISLVSRRLVPRGSWSGQATFRATVGEAETTEHIITAEIESQTVARLPRRPLKDGENLPSVFGKPAMIVREFEKAAAIQLEKLRREREARIVKEQREELQRIRSGYKSQISEAPYEDRRRLERALESEEKRLDRRPDVRARAKVLALAVEEDDWVVEETWTRQDGVKSAFTYEWGLKDQARVVSAASGTPVAVLSMCSSAHFVDDSDLGRCESCDRELCGACGEEARMLPCPLCELPICGKCRRETGGLCLRCTSPERAPELDREYSRAWLLNGGSTLYVGRRCAELVRPGEPQSLLLVPDEDADDAERARVRAYAMANGLPADSGLLLIDRTGRRDVAPPTRLRLRGSEIIGIELTIEQGGGSSLDPSGAEDLPELPAVGVVPEGQFKLAKLLKQLRTQAPPIAPPAVVVTRRAEFIDVYLECDRLVREVTVVNDVDGVDLRDIESTVLEWRSAMETDPVVAQGTVAETTVSISRRNEALLIEAVDAGLGLLGQWVAFPEGVSASAQIGYFEVLRNEGQPGGRVGQRVGEATSIIGEFPRPTECCVGDRQVTPIVKLVEAEADAALVPADDRHLELLGMNLPEGTISMPPVPPELNRLLLGRAERSFTTVAMLGFKITESWEGHGAASNTYEVFDGQPLLPVMDDFGDRSEDFGICRDGHFYPAGTAALCSSCDTWACRACDEVDHCAQHSCPGCSALVCRRCLVSSHSVPSARCVNCGGHACQVCGCDPHVIACEMCERLMCSRCLVDGLCVACSHLTRAPQEQLSSLPEDLALHGASVLTGKDEDATVVYVKRGGNVERAVIRGGELVDWIAFGRSEIYNDYKLRLAASRVLAAQVVPVFDKREFDTRIEQPRITIDAEHVFRTAWEFPTLDAAGISDQTSPDRGDQTLFVGDVFPPLGRHPQPRFAVPQRISKATNRVPESEVHSLKLHWIPAFRDILVTDSGIVTITFLGEDRSEATAAWTQSSGSLDWVNEAWSPVPQVVLHARSGDCEAAVVVLGLMLALGVRYKGESLWFEITRSDEAPAATALSRWLGMGDADQVGIFTDPAEITFSSISNATSAAVREVQAKGTVTSDASPGGGQASAAIRAWLPEARIAVPEMATLPSELRAQLEKRARRATTPVRLDIGVELRESVPVVDGGVWTREVSLVPGETDARRIDDALGGLLDVGVLDREGHFSGSGLGCGYCRSWVCQKCEDGLATCGCCGIAICKRCIAKPDSNLGLCPACATLHSPTRREAREHGRLISTRGMLIGSDDFHTVVFEHTKSGWQFRHQGGITQPVVSAIAAYLDQLVRATDS